MFVLFLVKFLTLFAKEVISMFAHLKQLFLHLLLILFEKLFDFLAARFGVEDELPPDDSCLGYDAPYEEGDFNE